MSRIFNAEALLAEWGDPDAFADAELMLRSHRLPSQFRDVSFIAQPLPLPLRQLDVSYAGRTLHARCRGDQVVAMDNRGTDLSFFDPYSA